MHAFRSTLIFGAVSILAVSCGGSGGFDIHFPDNRPIDVGAIASTISSRALSPEAPVVVLVPPSPEHGASAFSLPDAHRLWQSVMRLDARPTIVGDAVISHADGQVVALDLQHGRVRWQTPDRGYSLIGAGGDAQYAAISLGPGDLNQRRGVFLVVDTRTGSSRIEQVVDQALGTPTAAGGYAAVPWNGQYLSIFDIARGSESARIRSHDDVFSRAERDGNAIYFGSRVIYRVGREAASGNRDAHAASGVPRDDLPGNPPLMNDGYVPSFAGVNARERVAMVWRPDPALPGVRMVDDTAYVIYHRTVFALDMQTEGGPVRWAYVHTADIAGSQPVRGGFFFVDEQGRAVMLDSHHGNPVYRHALGVPAAQAVIRLPIDFVPPHANDEPAQSPGATLRAVAASTDNRLLPARIFAAHGLATVNSPDATSALLDILNRRNDPQDLRAAAGEALSHRTDGLDLMIQALAAHNDYLTETRAAPVGFIAHALATAHEHRAVPSLISHLEDPSTPTNQLPPLVAALKDFADPSAIPALLDFVRLYHADEGAVPPLADGPPVNDRTPADQEAIASALELAVQALAQMGGATEQRWLRALQADTNTTAAVRNSLDHVSAASSPSASAQPSSVGGDNNSATTPTTEPSTENDPNFLPPRASSSMITEAFSDTREQMMACVRALPSRPDQVRLQFRYDGEGNISTVTLTPPSLQSCIAPIASQVHLPPTQTAREIGTYYLLGGAL